MSHLITLLGTASELPDASVQFVLVELNNKKISNLKKLKTKFDGRRQTLTDAFENDILFHILFQTKNNK